MGFSKLILTMMLFTSLYDVLHHGLLANYPEMWSNVIQSLGYSYLVQKIYQKEESE
jgi:hypothetical protein